jgi:hypothetical protein
MAATHAATPLALVMAAAAAASGNRESSVEEIGNVTGTAAAAGWSYCMYVMIPVSNGVHCVTPFNVYVR